jgi:hypothetical protein
MTVTIWRSWKLPVTVLAVLALLAAGIGVGLGIRDAFANNGGGVIYACKGDRSGSIRVVSNTNQCLRGETLISWNVEGPPGPAGAVGMIWRGTWSAATAYAATDAVEYQGSAYIAVTPNQNQAPGTGSAWQLLAQGSGPAASRTIGGHVADDGSVVSGSGFTAQVVIIDDEGFEIPTYRISFPAGTWSNGFVPVANAFVPLDPCACLSGPPIILNITANPDGSGSFDVADMFGEPFSFTFVATGT